MTRISPIDCPFCCLSRLRPLRWLPDPRHARRHGGARYPPMRRRSDGKALEPMTAPGTWSSPPRGAIAVPATASLSPSSAAAFHRPAVAGSRARSIAPGPLRSGFRLAHPGRVAAAGSPAPAARAPGAASSPATAAAAPGRRRGAERVARSPHGAERNPGQLCMWIDLSRIALRSIRATGNRKRPAGSSDGPLHINEIGSIRISAAPAPSRPGGLRNARPARPWRTRRRRP